MSKCEIYRSPEELRTSPCIFPCSITYPTEIQFVRTGGVTRVVLFIEEDNLVVDSDGGYKRDGKPWGKERITASVGVSFDDLSKVSMQVTMVRVRL